jgi:DNA repair exonuclease SbcCD ATPase subunit
MMKCKNECPNETINFNGCCVICPDRASCEDACGKDPVNCGDSIPDADNEETALAAFQEQQITLLDSIAALVQKKKDLDEQEAELKVQLQTAMEAYGIKKFTSDILNITYVAATNAESVDSKKLKAKYPDVAAECVKISNRKAYIKVELKGGKKDERL